MILEAKGLTKSFGDLSILKELNLEVEAGEIISIVGSSGAGKTTLLQILGTLDRPDNGQVIINSKDVFAQSDRKLAQFRNSEIGFIFQFHQLLPEFTAFENIILPGMIGGKTKAQLKDRAEMLMKTLGISDRANHQPNQLSGGEQQRIAVARALINEPNIVFADEPSGNLDSTTSEALHQLFFDLREKFNCAFVIVTHNEKLANLADRKLTLKDGAFL